MANGCCVFGCNFKYCNREFCGKDVSVHSFPKRNEEQRKAWISAVRRENWQPSNRSVICSQHFRPEDMDLTGQTRRLREGVVPSIFPAYPKHLQQKTTPRKPPKLRVSLFPVPRISPSSLNSPSGSNEAASDTSISSVLLPLVTRSTGTPLKSFTGNIQSEAEHSILRSELSSSGDFSIDSERSDPLTPRKRKLISQLTEKTTELCSVKKKIKSLQQKVRRQSKKIESDREIIASLVKNKMITESAADILKTSLPTDVGCLLDMTLKKSDNKYCGSYDPKLRSFALTLHYYSPKAYEFVRSKFNNALPSTRTIRAWYMKVDCEPGFSKECFDAIGNKVKNANSNGVMPLVCLSIDDMSLKEHIEFDDKKIIGYVDLGTEIQNDCLPPAKMACVIMCTSINDTWKIPCGYFFIDSLSGKERAQLILTALEKLGEIGVRVTAVTFDGAASNISMANALGANLSDVENLKIHFPHPGVQILALLDACHMIKLVRNCIAEKQVIYSRDGVVKWSYIDDLFNLQKKEGLRLANKLSTRHIQWKKHKMRVRPAVQTLSQSVADALTYCNNVLKLDDFLGCEATVNFIQYMNKTLDLLNSSSKFGKGFKAPLCCSNEHVWRPFITDALSYIVSLSVSAQSDQSILASNRRVGFLGLKICLMGLQEFFDVHIKNKSLEYLLTYKLSQDHVELFFGLIRQRGGWNNNPSCLQFKSAFKRLVVRNELKMNRAGNCVQQGEVNMLYVSSTSEPRSTQFLNEDEEGFQCLLSNSRIEDHDYIPAISSLTLYSENVTEYIAGYIVKAILPSICCDSCRASIQSRVNLFPFIMFKNKGNLCNPSKDVFKICKLTEQCFRESESHNLNSVINRIIPVQIAMKSIELGIFASLEAHALDLNPLDTHINRLVQVISWTYLKIRIHHATREMNRRVLDHRSTYNRLAIFKHL